MGTDHYPKFCRDKITNFRKARHHKRRKFDVLCLSAGIKMFRKDTFPTELKNAIFKFC